jgi:hypothetical protein
MPSDSVLQQMILNEVGANIPDFAVVGVITDPPITDYWDFYSDFSNRPFLKVAYVKRSCINHVIGQLRDKVNATMPGLNPQLGSKLANLQNMLAEVNAEISEWTRYYNASRPPVVAPFTRKAPIIADPLFNEPDPNSRGLRGDPLRGPYEPDDLSELL